MTSQPEERDQRPSGAPHLTDVPVSWATDAALGKALGESGGSCLQLQFDLSCLLDGELDGELNGDLASAADANQDAASLAAARNERAARAIDHLDACPGCRSFFDDVRAQVRAHRDLADTEGLVARYADWVGVDAGLESIELVTKLASIFYQLGKAYVVASLVGRQRVFEQAVEVDPTQTNGRGFVDGVLASGRERVGGIDWRNARKMLNGQLASIQAPRDKGRALLEEALVADPTHEEARLYLALLDAEDGRTIRAAEEFRDLFRTAIDPANRAHSAIQLGLLLADQREYRRAIACFRWVIASGLADEDDRFFVARFNVGIHYALAHDQARSLSAFRQLLDRHPGRVGEIADLFLDSSETRRALEAQPGFAEALLATCPELFSLDGAALDDPLGGQPRGGQSQ